MTVDAVVFPGLPHCGRPSFPIIGMEGRARRRAGHHLVTCKMPFAGREIGIDRVEGHQRHLRDVKGVRIVAAIIRFVQGGVPDIRAVRKVAAMVWRVEILPVPAIGACNIESQARANWALGKHLIHVVMEAGGNRLDGPVVAVLTIEERVSV